MKKKGFVLNCSNELLCKVYNERDNYRVDNISEKNECYIFFSSNGIYFPNTEESFEKTIIENDRYEWMAIGHSEEIMSRAGKIIYVRDIFKQYYVSGINYKINSIDKLCRALETITLNMQVITCGISSGGYLATIIGIYLNAKKIYNFGGQWSLEKELATKTKEQLDMDYSLLVESKLSNRYYDITHLLDNNQIPIFYFYSALNENDNIQIDYLKKQNLKNENVYCFAMKSKEHGYVMFSSCLKKILQMDMESLINLYKKNSNKIISLRKMCWLLLPIKDAIKENCNDFVHNHKSLQYILGRTKK